MGIKILIAIALIIPVGAANTDDEIIKNLDFFQSMELLKEEVTFAMKLPDGNETKVKTQTEKKSDAPEKK